MSPVMSRKESLRLESYLRAEMRAVRRRLAPASRRDPDAAVHEARRAIKKLRAALRLAREAFPRKDLAPVEGPLRNAARLLGPLRDRTVVAKTARKLGVGAPSSPPMSAAGRMNEAGRELALAARALRRLPWKEIEPGFFVRGLKRLYRRGRKALREAEARPSAAALHTWRKRTKDFVYALALAGSGTVRKGRKLAKKGARLGEKLGKEHDLAVFVETFGKGGPSLRRRVAKKERRLRKRVLREGRAVFGRKVSKL